MIVVSSVKCQVHAENKNSKIVHPENYRCAARNVFSHMLRPCGQIDKNRDTHWEIVLKIYKWMKVGHIYHLSLIWFVCLLNSFHLYVYVYVEFDLYGQLNWITSKAARKLYIHSQIVTTDWGKKLTLKYISPRFTTIS